jgi:hypothetical protein
MMKPLSLTVVSFVLGATLVACGGGNDKPAVCDSVDTLKGSISDLKDIDITSAGAVSSLETGLATVKTDFDALKTDAKSEFSPQIQAVDSAYTVLQSSAEAAKSDPSAASIAAVAAAAATFASNVQTLVQDVQATC